MTDKKIKYLPALEDANIPLTEQQLAILEKQVEAEQPNPTTQSSFNYAWGLVKSDDVEDNRNGINILVSIFTNVPQRRRECLYYLSLGCLKLNELENAKRYVDGILAHEPDNYQALQLKQVIENKISRDGLVGIALFGGAVAIGAAALSTMFRYNRKK
ncbi:hypothetical protein LJB42_001278 [Komagataella kurtzmanii]|nr:hypothetical protein LJB42_001278 [Komagataella kurtzmanii]